ncbi:hypothetical protein JTE90_017243 [Oedothorax gibbosus]|uniref:Major facilitator superfamily associated domain-containing protein n=1 Tax=Oedothorax gibbosus TaxID=931172 RepID=A0AAV6VDN3_9ARAC|nr:hypothetical protein JTE90_017243 [Oedothorax gibbosus]
MGGVIPFMQVMAKGLGINATAAGLIFTMVSICVFFSKPAFGFITDYFKNMKLVVFILVAVTAVTYMSAVFIPAIKNTHWTTVLVDWCENASELRLEPPQQSDNKCLREALKREVHCEFEYTPCGSDVPLDLSGVLSIYHAIENLRNGSSVDVESSSNNSTLFLRLKPDRAHFTCDSCITSSNSFRCVSPMIRACLNLDKEDSYVYKMFNFGCLRYLL